MMGECADMIHSNSNKNETENSLDTLDKIIEKFPDITSPAMIEYCENNEHDVAPKMHT